MKMRAFSVYDSKSEAFMLPFFLQSVGQAKRMFEDAVNDERSVFSKHPADYILFEIGLFDDNTGELIRNGAAVNHGLALTYRVKEKGLQVVEPEKIAENNK